MMNKLKALCALLSIAASACFADVVVTNDGSRLSGEITLIDSGVIHLKTSFAGTLKIKQSEVASFETNNPVVVRLESGTTMEGPIKLSTAGKLRIVSQDGVLETNTAGVAATWMPGQKDPGVVRDQRKWQYQAGVDLVGRDGNTDEFALGINLQARLASRNDELAFFAEYEQTERNNTKTADRAAGGMSYESFFSEYVGWYVRSELETDAIEAVDLRSTSGLGASWRLIQKDHQRLVFRSGLGYRYTAYDSATRDNDSEATLDFGLNHRYRFQDYLSMTNSLTFVPSIEDFSNYRAVHDSGVEIPVGSGDNWKIRIGLKNEYNSKPVTDEKIDTTYYTRMIYSWD